MISRKKIQIVVKLACFFAGIKPPNTYDIVQKSTTYSSKIFTVSNRCITRLRALYALSCARSTRPPWRSFTPPFGCARYTRSFRALSNILASVYCCKASPRAGRPLFLSALSFIGFARVKRARMLTLDNVNKC